MASRPSDESFFDAFFEAHRESVARYFLRLTGDRHQAEDLAQETFVTVWKRHATLAHHPEPVRWLFKVATHFGLDYFRRLRRRQEDALPLFDEYVSPERAIEDHVADRDEIDWAIRQLPPKMRQAWVLREVYGFSLDEVAEIVSTSKGAVKRALSRARARLMRLCQLEDDGWPRDVGEDEDEDDKEEGEEQL